MGNEGAYEDMSDINRRGGFQFPSPAAAAAAAGFLSGLVLTIALALARTLVGGGLGRFFTRVLGFGSHDR